MQSEVAAATRFSVSYFGMEISARNLFELPRGAAEISK